MEGRYHSLYHIGNGSVSLVGNASRPLHSRCPLRGFIVLLGVMGGSGFPLTTVCVGAVGSSVAFLLYGGGERM